eukprot:CAMPEP_0205819472 /NCGR_PEP_ID=MMETSP0206-20130828/1858_1 /ASSEMBLY_ACC=CAM_ASM_000279 /TAXON_ID=36767 /ORGANISM="Euplotes focardii, Strain TN1" /LENGTH=342 /DNA_ID=CAMNT_0053113109 /DNA_START=6 /DNA_END=1034 /DNA_ORIENTATION=-
MTNKKQSAGIDWSGLFAWSNKYVDGTKSTNFDPMDKEEKEWLQKAMQEFSFSETDKLQDIISILLEHRDKEKGVIIEALEELEELIDIHPRNSVNLERSGGFKLLMDTMLNNNNGGVRRLAMRVFGSAVQNTSEMQAVAHTHGGLKLMYQYIKESDEKNKEQVIGALSSLIRTSEAAIKSEFFREMEGLDWLRQIILDENTSKRTLKKVYFLLYDLIVKETDKSIDVVLTDENLIKDYLLRNTDVVLRMITSINYQSKDNLFSDHVLREYILKCLGSIFQYRSEALSPKTQEYFVGLSKTIAENIYEIRSNNGDEDTVHLLANENEIIMNIAERNGDFLLIH